MLLWRAHPQSHLTNHSTSPANHEWPLFNDVQSRFCLRCAKGYVVVYFGVGGFASLRGQTQGMDSTAKGYVMSVKFATESIDRRIVVVPEHLATGSKENLVIDADNITGMKLQRLQGIDPTVQVELKHSLVKVRLPDYEPKKDCQHGKLTLNVTAQPPVSSKPPTATHRHAGPILPCWRVVQPTRSY